MIEFIVQFFILEYLMHSNRGQVLRWLLMRLDTWLHLLSRLVSLGRQVDQREACVIFVQEVVWIVLDFEEFVYC